MWIAWKSPQSTSNSLTPAGNVWPREPPPCTTGMLSADHRCAMQPPDPMATDRLKSPQETVSSAPRGTIASVIFSGLLAAGMTLWAAIVLCELALVIVDIWRLEAWEVFKYIPFVQQTALRISIPVLVVSWIFYHEGDYSDHPELPRRARRLLKLLVVVLILHRLLDAAAPIY